MDTPIDEERPCRRPCQPSGNRRAKWHDYYAPGIYMITVNKAEGIRRFSSLADDPPRCILTETGTDLSRNIQDLLNEFKGVRILQAIIMPEHVHFIIYITVSGLHPGTVISWFKSRCTLHYHGYTDKRTVSENKDRLQPVFMPNYHDRILTERGQLDRMIKYVADNPRRRLDRMKYPDFHRRTMLKDETGTFYEAYGDPNILDDPDIRAVRISRTYTDGQLHTYKKIWLHTILNGGILVSPFISEAERRVRDWAIDNGGHLIIIVENGFGPRYAPKEPWHTLCTRGRLLLIAPAQHSTSAITLTRAACMSMNALAAAIADHRLKPV